VGSGGSRCGSAAGRHRSGRAALGPHRRAVESLIAALETRRNWYLDLSNERNIQDKRFTSFDDLLYIAGALHQKEIHGKRLGAISGAGFEAVGMAD